MNREKYYEILINKGKYGSVYGDKSLENDECDKFEKILYLFFSIKELSLEDIDNKINGAEEVESKILLQELRYVKEYQILSQKYSKVFTLLKHNLQGKLVEEAKKIENNDDIITAISSGQILLGSSYKPLYLGICLALILDRINRIDEAIGIIKKISDWYPENDETRQYMKKLLRDIYFRNRMHQPYKHLIADEQDKLLTYLYKNIRFFQFKFNFFVLVYVIAFLILWFVLDTKFVIIFFLYLIFSITNIILSFKKKEPLLFLSYIIQTVYFVIIFVVDALFSVVTG